MSSPYDLHDRGSSRRRGVWTHWVPFVLTVTVATVGLAAWAWSQRNDDDEETNEAVHAQNLDYNNADYGDNPPYGATRNGRPGPPPSFHSDLRPGEAGYGTAPAARDGAEAGGGGWGARMSGALRRTSSPQQFFDSAGKTVAAGMAAAGAVVGSALASIREEDKGAYADHETWSEEADAKRKGAAVPAASSSKEPTKRRQTVAIVVSAATHIDDTEDDGFHEHASILSHIPKNIDFSKTKLFILIYAPDLKDSAIDATSNLPPASLSSSFSNISHNQAQSPKDEKSPLLNASATNPGFHAIYSQALALAEKETMVLPFTSANGHSHILRHLQPDVVYLQESLAGENGGVVTQLQTWLSKDIILVVGAESGHGGLADSESEAERPGNGVPEKKWWQREERAGRGRGVVVVDGMRVGDDWARRVQGKE